MHEHCAQRVGIKFQNPNYVTNLKKKKILSIAHN